MNKERGKILNEFGNGYLFVVIFVSILFGLIFLTSSQALKSGTNLNATSNIWTSGTANSINSTFGTIHSKDVNYWNFRFFANYTNVTGVAINVSNGNGTCLIQFNQTSSFDDFVNMSYNSSSSLWEYNRSFSYKGNLSFQTQCNSSYGNSNITLTDYFIVSNTAPWINKTEINKRMASVSCTEDNISSCTYNLTIAPYVIEDDYNDRASLNFAANSNTTLTNYTLLLGIFVVNKSVLNQSTSEDLYFTVTDSSALSDSGILPVSVIAVNDAPYFTNLQNQSFNMSSVFNYNVSAADEENNINFTFNISFVSCSVAFWSTRNCSTAAGRELFNSSYWGTLNGTALNISFNATKNDVGSYIVNFTVKDLNNDLIPKNASTSYTVNFTVLNINSMPYFMYVCNNERNTTENSVFSCYINVSDTDETNNLTVSANYSWFTFNSTLTNSVTLPINVSITLNVSAFVNFTVTDSAVGNFSINISLSDSNNPAGTNSTVISFFVNNSNDNVTLINLNNGSAVVGVLTTIYANASDNDLLIPDKRVYNETLTLTTNASWINVSSQEVNGNVTVFSLSVNADSSVVGNNSINLTVRDANNYSIDSQIINITVTASAGSTPAAASSGGGGGGGRITVIKPVSLKLLLPEPIFVNKSGNVILPITLENNGQVNLTNISLSGTIGKNGTLIVNIKYYFTQDFFVLLVPGEKKSTSLVVEINITENGVYEFSVNASVKSPSYTDYGKAYINVREGQVTESKIVFAEQLIISNEVCTNIQSLLDEAKALYDNKDFIGAEDKLDRAISDCKQAIDQVQAQAGGTLSGNNIKLFTYVVFAVILALGGGFAYYMYQQMKLKRILDENDF